MASAYFSQNYGTPTSDPWGQVAYAASLPTADVIVTLNMSNFTNRGDTVRILKNIINYLLDSRNANIPGV